MPINAYTGLMGSGKSYECVSSVIVPAIKSGRRVVTNVDGIDSDAIRAYCQDTWDLSPDKIGHVVHCSNEDVSKPSFLPYGENVDTFCKPGDIICIDEAWRFWGTDCKLLPEHKIFFREHRHFVHPVTKVCCDLVLMVQDIGDLHRILKVVVEVTFKTTKIKTLGWSKTYRVEMWEGHKLTQRGRVSVQNKQYDANIFPLYSSYQGGAGKELQVDDRQNILKSPKLWILAGLTVVLFSVGIYNVIGFFTGSKYKEKQQTHGVDTASSSSAASSPQASSNAPQAPLHADVSDVSDVWRIVGHYQVGHETFVAIANSSGSIRLEHPSVFQNTGLSMVGTVDGLRVMYWSGAHPQQAKIIQ
jgi:zona occludens toxin